LSQDYLQSLKVKKTNVFLTAPLVRFLEPQTVGFPVKKLGKEFKVNLSNYEMSFLTNFYQYLKLSPSKVLSLFAFNPGSNEIIIANNPD
jgi:hypothetical protein